MDRFISFNLLFIVALFPLVFVDAFYDNYEIHIDTNQRVSTTDEKFLSIALDSGLIRHRWEYFDFNSERLRNLAAGLAPAYLRIGGTDEDFLLFSPNRVSPSDDIRTDWHEISRDESMDGPHSTREQSVHSSPTQRDQHIDTSQMSRDQRIQNMPISHDRHMDISQTSRDQIMHPLTNYTMTTSDVDKIFKFAKDSELNIIFGLNVLLRDHNTHTWNSTNAQQLMKYITSRGFSCAWELGNEPFDLHGLVNKTITGQQLAEDFKILRKLLNNHPEYGEMLVGPDVSSPWRPPRRNKYLEEFLTNIDEVINAMTYHQYYTNNKTNVSQFYNPDLLDDLIREIYELQGIMKESGASSIDLWLGETSSAYGGGVPGVSNSYIAGFMWLDKLGVAARLDHKVVVRQTFYGGSYSLIDDKNLEPLPDYWSSYLYKKLVGSRVLEVEDGIALGRTVRVYAHCTSKRSGYGVGSLVLIVLNTQLNEVQLVLTNGLEKRSIDQYLLTPGESHNLTSQAVKLNGKLLQLVDDKFLPKLEPESIIPPDNIKLPPVSFGFYVIPKAEAKACKTPQRKMKV